MDSAEFVGRVTKLGFNLSAFARRLIELGDTRSFATLRRSITNYATGNSSVPGEIVVILTLMERDKGARGVIVQRRVGRPPKVPEAAA